VYCLLSKEGKEYIFGFEETPFYKSTELFPIFETTDERIGYRHKYKAEDHGWKYLEKENALIREDILDEYSKAAAEAKRENFSSTVRKRPSQNCPEYCSHASASS